jgi:hypothetical protein
MSTELVPDVVMIGIHVVVVVAVGVWLYRFHTIADEGDVYAFVGHVGT